MKEELSAQEKKVFDSLKREQKPPAGLRKNIVERLNDEKLLKQQDNMKNYLKWAAVVALIVISYFVGLNSTSTTVEDERQAMAYMLILQEDENFHPGVPEEMFSEYRDWMISIGEKGIDIDGQELKNQAVLVKASQEVAYLGEEEFPRLTGYFVVEATSLDEAIALAKANPHIKYGGSIHVKEFMIR